MDWDSLPGDSANHLSDLDENRQRLFDDLDRGVADPADVVVMLRAMADNIADARKALGDDACPG